MEALAPTQHPPWEKLPSELWDMAFLELVNEWWNWVGMSSGATHWETCGAKTTTFYLRDLVAAPTPDVLNWALSFPTMRRQLIETYGGGIRYPPRELLLRLVDAELWPGRAGGAVWGRVPGSLQ
ncbi:hypothetical protein QOT17_015844 [Balamuthia mandrillaris]